MIELWDSLDTTVQVAIVTGVCTIVVAIIGLFKERRKKGTPTKTVVKQVIKGDADNVSMTAIQNNYGVQPKSDENEKGDKQDE